MESTRNSTSARVHVFRWAAMLRRRLPRCELRRTPRAVLSSRDRLRLLCCSHSMHMYLLQHVQRMMPYELHVPHVGLVTVLLRREVV